MCWSLEASATVAAIGLATTAYAAHKKSPPAIWVPLAYFSLMEILQAYTYTVIDDCGNVANQVATVLGYVHIAFQPFLINLISLYFIPPHIRKKWEIPAYLVCFITAIIMIVQLYPYQGAEKCVSQGVINLCGSPLCSFSGNWHIAWSVPFSPLYDFFSITIGGLAYCIAAFGMPLLYGSWKMTLYHLCMGPLFASLTTPSLNERAAVWCLLSIGFLIIALKTPLRKWLRVHRWIWWRE